MIANLQRRYTELGRIRLGTRVNGRQQKIDTFRFTSAAQHLIEEIAALYGGEARPWQNEKKSLWEVITGVDVIPVYVPRQQIDPWYESWARGVCTRRCDGIRDLIHDKPCDCQFDQSGKPSNCKPTTRVNVELADIPGYGVWRLETHGIYAAGELTNMAPLIAAAPFPLPARLVLEKRDGKRFDREEGKVKTLDYNVPVLMFDGVTSRQFAIGGDAITQALRASGLVGDPVSAMPAIETATAPALPATPQPPAPAEPDPALIEKGLAFIAGCETDEQMADAFARIERMGKPQVLVEAFQLRLGELAVLKTTASRTVPPLVLDGSDGDGPPGYDESDDDEFPADSQAPAAAPVAPPAAPEPAPRPETPPAAPSAPAATESASGDRVAAMTRLLGVAGSKGLKRTQVDERMQSDYGVTLKSATAQQLNRLAGEL